MRRMIALAWVLVGCGTSHMQHEDAATHDAARDGDQTVHDAGVERIDAGGPRTDAGTDAAIVVRAAGIVCGAGACDLETEGCLASCQRDGIYEPACVATNDDHTWPSEECPSGMERFPRYWLTCDGPEDCPPDAPCRLLFGSTGNYARCGFGQSQLCHVASDCPADEPRCVESTDLPGYRECRAEL